MVKAMKLRDINRALSRAGCSVKAETGPHTKWVCLCGQHSANIPRHATVSPGVVASTITRMACLPGGWLQ
ncbi:MAG TPA: hypothetical protein VMV92_43660 [Streptosporangiaceae bacterium]|nr:hypothetical protein [Streptosporangiaceae bacterium]